MLTGVPFVHTVEDGIMLMNGEYRAFSKHVQLTVGYNGSNFDDVIIVGIKTGHFQVNPDQVIFAFGHGLRLFLNASDELTCHRLYQRLLCMTFLSSKT